MKQMRPDLTPQQHASVSRPCVSNWMRVFTVRECVRVLVLICMHVLRVRARNKNVSEWSYGRSWVCTIKSAIENGH